MNDEMDDVLDALLRDQFDGPVPDEGFCDRVMDRLPARSRRKICPVASGAIGGAGACWLSLWSAPIAQAGWRDWLSGNPSAEVVTLFLSMVSVAVLAMIWTIAEADDRQDRSVRQVLR